jgi:hypothetical protein
MRVRFLPILLVVAGSVHAADTFNVGHRVIPDDGQPAAPSPMAWPYRLLQTAQDLFEKKVDAQAPGAAMTFRLPKVDPARTDNNQVEIVQAGRHIPLPMVSATTFAFMRDTEAADANAMVVVNRNFPGGERYHPTVQVRSPGLPDGVNRMGDLRLACAAQMAMAKAEGFKFRAALATASVFGLDVCDKLEVTKLDAPAEPYDTVTIEDGDRRLVMPAAGRNLPRLGDKNWSDNARISYSLNVHTPQ